MKQPKRMQVEAGRVLSINGVPVVVMQRIAHGPGLSPTEADAFVHYCASIIDWNKFKEYVSKYRRGMTYKNLTHYEY